MRQREVVAVAARLAVKTLKAQPSPVGDNIGKASTNGQGKNCARDEEKK